MVENQSKNKSKLFGRSEYMTSVIFDGDKKYVGQIVKVKIKKSNQRTLFGEIDESQNKRVA